MMLRYCRQLLERGVPSLLVLVLVALTACGANPPETAPAKSDAAKPGEAAKPGAPAASQAVRIGVVGMPRGLDFNAEGSHVYFYLWRNMYDSLVDVDAKGKILPALAESWSNPSPTTWEFKIRPNVKFHNGEPFTAESARFTLVDRVLKAENNSAWRGRLGMIDKVEAVNDSTLRITTKGPSAVLLPNLIAIYMLPSKYFQEVGDKAFAEKPVGTGPFKFKEFKRDDSVTLEAYPDYWGGAPKLTQITFKAIQEFGTRVAALEAGEIDLVYDVPPDDVDRIKTKGFEIVSQPTGQTEAINLIDNHFKPKELMDKRVRQALNYAVDLETMHKSLFLGYGTIPTGQIIGPDGFGFNPNLKAYPYDPAKAKQLLAEAGYPNGISVTINGSVGRYLKDKEVVQAIANYWEAVGVKTKIDVLENAEFSKRQTGGTIGPVWISSWIYLPAMDLDNAVRLHQCSSDRKYWCNEKFEELFKKQETTLDPKEREKILWEINQLQFDEARAVYLLHVPNIYGVNKKLKNVSFRADAGISLHTAQLDR